MDIDNVDFYLYDLKTKFNKINPKEYYLSYSGGKDSHLLYWFIKKYAPEFKDIKVVGINTYMEHPQIRKRIYDNSDEVLLPNKKPFEIKENMGFLVFQKSKIFIFIIIKKQLEKEKLQLKHIEIK